MSSLGRKHFCCASKSHGAEREYHPELGVSGVRCKQPFLAIRYSSTPTSAAWQCDEGLFSWMSGQKLTYFTFGCP